MSLERQTAAGLKWSAAGKLLSQAFTWVVTLALLRLLAPADYGLVALSSVVIATIAAIADVGMGASLVQARDVNRTELARAAGALMLVNGAAAVLLALAAPWIADVFDTDDALLTSVLRVSALQFVLNALAVVPQSMAYREMRFKWLSLLDVLAAVVSSLATLLLALAGQGVWALVLGSLGGAALRTLLLLALGTWAWPQFALRGLGHHLRFGGAVTASRIVWQLAHQADIVVAGRTMSRDAVGLYAVVMQLATLPMQKTMSVLNQVAFPAMARLQDELPRLRARLIAAIRLLFFAAVPALWGIAGVAPEIVELLLDERWAGAVFPLQMASLAAPLRMLAAVLSTAIAAVGRADLDLRNSITTFVVFVAAFMVGAHWGVDGLAASWIGAVALVFALNWPRASGVLGMRLNQLLSAGHAPVAGGLAMLGVVWATRLALPGLALWARLPLLVLAGAGAYLGVVTLLDRSIWNELRRFLVALR